MIKLRVDRLMMRGGTERYRALMRRAPGTEAIAAGVVGGAALGFAGGMIADEVFDSFGDDEGGDEEA